MSNRKGWVKLHRKIIDNEIWQEKPFDKAHAWVDLIFLVNSQDMRYQRSNGEYIPLHRGEWFTSIRFLCDRWGWTIPKVKRYLKALEGRQMIKLVAFSDGTAIKIINYDKYQNFTR